MVKIIQSVFLFLTICTIASAQTQPARHAVVVPTGYSILKANGRSVLVETNDAQWVQPALAAMGPTTLPSTMPADILAKFSASREQIKKRMMDDLAITDPAVVDKFFDRKLQPLLKQFIDYHPPLFYIVITQTRLKELLKSGWSDPRFYYNRAADDVQISGAFNLSIDQPGDDILLPIIYDPAYATDKKQELLNAQIHESERSITEAMANRAMVVTQVAMVDFIILQVSDPTKLKDDQTWIATGLSGVLSSEYAAMITRINAQLMEEEMSSDNPRNPIRSETIDLLHPTAAADMRPEAVRAYNDAYRRKAARVVLNWLKKGGQSATGKVIAAIHANPPADGAALIKMIQQISGVDLSTDVEVGK
jgi:hypothetical protein